MLRFFASLFLTFAFAGQAFSSPEKDAADLALADAQDFPYPAVLRYLHLTGDEQIEDYRVHNYEMNLVSCSPIKSRLAIIRNDKATIVRIDTRLFAPPKHWDRFTNAWEKLATDPKFTGLITQGALDIAKIVPTGTSRRITSKDGVRIIETEAAADALKRDGVLRVRPAHVGPNWIKLATLLQTEAPIVNGHYFTFRSMLSIRDKDQPLYSSVFGGLYYELAGIQDTLDELLESLGVGNKQKNAKQIFEELRSDQRAAMWRSDVTGRMRLVEVFKTLAGRQTQGLFSLTSDFGEADVDVDQNPIANLLQVNRVKAHEGIWERPNGMHGFGLWNAQLKLQDSVPDDVAKDHLAPTPQTGRLQPPFSCIRCHGREDGWHSVANDARTILKSGKVDLLGDLTRKNQQDAIDRALGLYLGDFDEIFRRGRNDNAVNIFSVTGPWPKSKSQLDVVKQAAKQMESIIDRYWWKQVGPLEALKELGYTVDAKDAAKEFSRYVLQTANQVVIEDSRVSALRVGLKINRAEWDLVYSFIAR